MLPCQQLFLSTRRDLPSTRLYICEPAMTAAVIYGPGPDEEMLQEVCKGCKKAPPTSLKPISGEPGRNAHIRGWKYDSTD